ncbi:MAG: bifunctional 5,10-methylenetetrahydrofolate dehydrogenase/5,10-methenyltetrahydrofolate cyclohydrolase [Microgenomates group bacterium]|jgi:methylenetetrahydrofolate dehydrogenase (NADP+)/methenyltetrahydrofolate cyclohydrolase|nr:bifunctional 5,10-methylenetetrahydrofolate dehydrogenase/5,10-methenyltetrahydrofolate cyclohydrolase [Candidatus Woesebacteria bacterium]MBP6883357.1 bifunctional 5,10-methylenetetrahydrofolate dehydrogenase/5,10-methenyltetrahydrofolate cyclohydrolase [Candidatus Woesebacteria bacterium]QQR64209.1 MAG: bifunctional 5,10-methylenetetrahydrofolate dehydrogenase/5,10-methenyltetrahydrofolate cyclohydrolase [Candidatus Roizmanbacteria bacterium]
MKIPCSEISISLKQDLKKRVADLKKRGATPKLTTVLIGTAADQLSFVAIKKKVAAEIGVEFEFSHFKKCPPFLEFATKLRELAHRPNTTGVIIQLPLPSHVQSDTLYNYIPSVKDIEGHRTKSPHLPPLGLAVISLLKFIASPHEHKKAIYPDTVNDKVLFKQMLKHKKIVLVGSGVTGGHPIAQALQEFRVGFINVNSRTHDPDQYYREADIIITSVGKKVIKPEMLKKGVILINTGLHKIGTKLRGDYDEDEVKNIASWYTQTPNGTGPLDVLFLYKNLINAAELQLAS